MATREVWPGDDLQRAVRDAHNGDTLNCYTTADEIALRQLARKMHKDLAIRYAGEEHEYAS